MLNCFVPGTQGLDRLDPPPADIPEQCVWVDLLEPTLAEERAVERLLKIDVPSREEMRDIATSNRLYEENGTLYMTATVVTKIDTDRPESAAITFSRGSPSSARSAAMRRRIAGSLRPKATRRPYLFSSRIRRQSA